MSASRRVIGASVQGSSHLKTGQLCQDVCGWALTQDGVLIVAVADGAGSAEFSREGAAEAESKACLHLQISLWSEVPSDEIGRILAR